MLKQPPHSLKSSWIKFVITFNTYYCTAGDKKIQYRIDKYTATITLSC